MLEHRQERYFHWGTGTANLRKSRDYQILMQQSDGTLSSTKPLAKHLFIGPKGRILAKTPDQTKFIVRKCCNSETKGPSGWNHLHTLPYHPEENRQLCVSQADASRVQDAADFKSSLLQAQGSSTALLEAACTFMNDPISVNEIFDVVSRDDQNNRLLRHA